MTGSINPAVFGLLVLALCVWWMLRDEGDRTRPILVIAATVNLFYGWLLNAFMSQADSLLPWKFDHRLYRIDAALGVSAASFALALSRVSGWLNLTYQLLLPMMILWVALLKKRDRPALTIAYISEMIVGPLLYMILPACGPLFAFGASWLDQHSVQGEAIRLTGIPNAFPSLHVASALTLALFAAGRAGRAISIFFLVTTLLATLTTGEHYVIDLVAGLPFGVFAASLGRRRLRQAATYLVITLCWSLSIRLQWNTLIANPTLLRCAALLTVAISMASVARAWRDDKFHS